MVLEVLSSCSRANCYVLKAGIDFSHGGDCLLLDAGVDVSKVMISESMWSYDLRDVSGVLVTHEHQDHSRGLRSMLNVGLDAYMSEGTAKACGLDVGPVTRVHAVCAGEAFDVGKFTVLPFRTEHDAVEPLGYLIRYWPTRETALFATDTFYLRNTFPGVNYWLVECNHIRMIMDRQMEEGKLNRSLRRRLISSHMSMERLLEALGSNDLRSTRKIVLLHLSDDRSDEAEMVKTVSEITGIETVAADAGMIIDLGLFPF